MDRRLIVLVGLALAVVGSGFRLVLAQSGPAQVDRSRGNGTCRGRRGAGRRRTGPAEFGVACRAAPRPAVAQPPPVPPGTVPANPRQPACGPRADEGGTGVAGPG